MSPNKYPGLPVPAMSAADIARFWAKVKREGGANGCWVWTGALRSGYGKFRIGEKLYSAHRVAHHLVEGPLPVGLVLDHGHVCSNRRCVRPSHCEKVTFGVNSARSNVKRGRIL